MKKKEGVLLWEEDILIPTYGVGEPDKNPMFLEKRVYQGSSGRVYPLPVIDRIEDERADRKWRAVYLENEYLQVLIMPELGGRIQRALDKTNQYDFVYYNKVIKPALVGLAGPWISGGIEFNWPQHHRPTTFQPVDYTLASNEDGSKTVWLSEIDRMYGTKSTVGITLYPGKAYIEISANLYNPTSLPQTFLWWANPAYAVNNDTFSVFPPDVHAVFDHGKRDVSKFPIAEGTYYKVDYSAGVDIARYKNIPVPTSYMAYRSEFDFVGGYDEGRKAGLLHVADHHISPGKKQWTWGCGDFGKAWDRNLTDGDGPYIELMTGVYTDNQPDFSWLAPYEQKSFRQYFMPYKTLGSVKNASKDVLLTLKRDGENVYAAVYATSVLKNAVIELKGKGCVYYEAVETISPRKVFEKTVALREGDEEADLTITVKAAGGGTLLCYTPAPEKEEPLPEAAKPIGAPEKLESTEALFLAGMHLEQYRHATYRPEDYYLEGLKRDPGDMRINNAYGLLLFRQGQFEKSERYFRRAVETAVRHNPNPYDGEPYYNLALSLLMQGKTGGAYDAFFKACWSESTKSRGYFALAQIDMARGGFELALEHAGAALSINGRNAKAQNLKAMALRKLRKYKNAKQQALDTLRMDCLDLGALNELYLIAREEGNPEETERRLARLDPLLKSGHNALALSRQYADAGQFQDAIGLLTQHLALCEGGESVSPLVFYYLGWYHEKCSRADAALSFYKKGAAACSDYCFPNNLADILVLRAAQRANPGDAKAFYYLGNLFYDRGQYGEAIACFDFSQRLDGRFATVHRNLALAYYNKLQEPELARHHMEMAFALNQKDARVFYELDQLYKKLGEPVKERLARLTQYRSVVDARDDLSVEYVTLLNMYGQYAAAQAVLESRRFHPWEGGEGKITRQYVYTHTELAKMCLVRGDYGQAAEMLHKALDYPHNLGEGKLYGAQENDVYYYLGCAYEGLGETGKAAECFMKASHGLHEPASAVFYNDQPPEMIFYQGLALEKLGQHEKARQRYQRLIGYGREHRDDHVAVDYFAVSLPDFLIFDDDLDKRNVLHCEYLQGLGHLGLKNPDAAKAHLQKVLSMDPAHQGAITHLRMI